MYQLEQPKKRSGCLGKTLKFGLGGFCLLFLCGVVSAIFNSPVPSAGSGTAIPPTAAVSRSETRNTATAIPATVTPKPLATATLTVRQMQDQAETVKYAELARNTEKYTGNLLKYRGQVIQVIESSGYYELRVNITQGKSETWKDTILLVCPQCPERPLDYDIISFVGIVDGRTTYQSTLGRLITLPQLTARVFEVISD